MSVRFCIGLRWSEDEPIVEYECDSFEDALEEWHRLAQASNRPRWVRLFYRPEKKTAKRVESKYLPHDDKDVLVISNTDAMRSGGSHDMGSRPRGMAGGSR